MIYISHRLEEIFAVADRITVLRDGLSVDTRPAAEVEPRELIRLMVGRDISAVFPKEAVAIGAPVLAVEALTSAAAGIRDVTLTVGRGEILGIAGLVGSGRTELAGRCSGSRRPIRERSGSTARRFASRPPPTRSAPASPMSPRTAASTASSSTCRSPRIPAWRAWARCRAAA